LKLSISCDWTDLPPAISSDLLSSATVQTLRAGETLFKAGDKGTGFYRLEKGALKVILTSPQGEQRIVALLTSGAIVGDLSMIDGLPRSASVVAVTAAELSFVSRAAFMDCTNQHPEIYHYLTSLLANRLRETDETIAALAFLTVKGRVARALLEIARVLGKDGGSGGEILIEQMISQRELASMAGVARENVNRVLAGWKRQKLVTTSHQNLFIHDMSRLEREMDW
jgi:CRP/FNR family transcriptional regulator, cyclic AMP receptor protein